MKLSLPTFVFLLVAVFLFGAHLGVNSRKLNCSPSESIELSGTVVGKKVTPSALSI